MSETWKKWEGQVVDHKYQLLKHVGSTDHSVVFLAEFHDPELRQESRWALRRPPAIAS